MAKSIVDTVNDQVPITSILIKMGIDVPDSSSGSSWKTNCPFEEFYHIDGGRAKSLRVYFGTNSAYCFAGCGYLTPVSLYAMKTGLSRAEAASMLMQENALALPSFDDELQSLTNSGATISKASLRESLQIFCQTVAGDYWNTIQFSDPILSGLDNCLRLLDKVDNEENAKIWLTKSKLYMSALLKGIGNVKV
jgi:hypothetical protein